MKLNLECDKKYTSTTQTDAFKYIPGFRGIGRTDVYYSTAIEQCITLETNYKYYFTKTGEKGKFTIKDFEETGKSSLVSFLEMDELRGDKSILKENGYKNIIELVKYIEGNF